MRQRGGKLKWQNGRNSYDILVSVEHNNIAIYFGHFFTPRDINLRQVLIQKLTICPIYWQCKQYDMTKLYHDISLGENAVLCSTLCLVLIEESSFGSRSTIKLEPTEQ